MATERDTLAQIVYRVNNPHYGDYGHHEETADTILSAGYIRVVEDDETVEKLAYTLAREHYAQLTGSFEGWDDRLHWKGSRMVYEAMVRAALRALREDTE
jgi:hypothetical protein